MRPIKVNKFLLILIAVLTTSIGWSQDFSNKGKDFWVAYGSHVSMYNAAGDPISTGGTQNMVLYFTSDHDATVTVEIPALGFLKTYKVVANTVTISDPIPKTTASDARITAEGKSDKGIHITSDYSIIAYAHIYDGSISGASLLFPTNTLGRSYYSINYKQVSNSAHSYCYAYVIATEDSTNVEIILSANTQGGYKAGDTIKVALNKGELYNIFGKVLTSTTGEDLTGTLIRSVATATTSCKRIAVFSGSGKINISDNNSSKSADNYIQQALPANAWGKKYLTVPTAKMVTNIFRIAVSDPNTNVKLNGTLLSKSALNNNFYYEFQSNIPNSIESDLPIMLAQYITTTGCYGNVLNGNGDPEMIYLSPVEQTINKVTINSTPYAKIVDTLHFVNIVIPKGGVASLLVDGATPKNPITHPGDNSFVYYQVALRAGAHTIISDSGFNAIAYGYGGAESYGYNAGTNVVDLYQKLTVNNQYGTVKLPATCRRTPFKVSITLPYQPLSLAWNIPKYQDIPTDYAPQYDSTYIVNGRNIYRYSLNQYLTYDSVGNYNIQLKVFNPTGDGCSGEQAIDFDLTVYSPPKADYTLNIGNCLGDSLFFNDNTLVGPDDRKLIAYNWQLGNTNYVNAKNYAIKANTVGTTSLNYFVINEIGCLSDTLSSSFIIDSVPKVNFTVQNIKCIGKTIQIKDSSFASIGTQIAKWIWNYGDSSLVDTLTSSAAINHIYDSAKNYNIELSVATSNGCVVKQSKTIKINPNPLVGFVLPEICLKDPYAQFIDTTKIADASNNFKYLWDFGEPNNTQSSNTSIVANPKHRYLVPGTYQVNEKVTSINGCVADTTLAFTVNGSVPISSFNIIDSAALCSNLPVQLNNTSFVDIGKIGKLIIYWDYAKNPLDSTIDENPSINKIYKHNYSNFHFPDKMNYNISLVSYSGENCFDQKTSNISIVPPPQSFSISSTKDYLCIADSISFSPIINGGVPSFSYDWMVNNAAANFNNNVLSGITKGSVDIDVKVTDSLKCVYLYSKLKTIEVRDIPIATIQAKDTNICNQDPIVLKGAGSNQFKWYLNKKVLASSIVDTFTTNLPGFYKVQVFDGFCNSLLSDSVQIYQYLIPKYNFTNTNYICVNTPVRIVGNTFDAKGTHFNWNFGDSTNSTIANPGTHNYTKKGIYQIKIAYTNDYCPKYNDSTSSDSIKVVDPLKGKDYTMFVLGGIDTTLVNIKTDSGYVQYNWSPGTYLSTIFSKNPVFNGDKTIDYLLTRTDTLSHCQIEDTYHIIVSNDVVLSVPKAFTPNNDGLNDVLKLEYGAGLKTFNYFKLFNRWGKLIFETSNVNGTWDGKLNGKEQDVDAYTYLLDYVTFKDEHVTKTGSVILIR
jgi:gliding motility-associated-like protein